MHLSDERFWFHQVVFRQAGLSSLLLLLAVCGSDLAALDFPGLEPGPAVSAGLDGVFTLENNVLQVSWGLSNGCLSPLVFSNKLAGQSWRQAGSEIFRLGEASDTNAPHTLNLRASDFVLVGGPELQVSQISTQSSRVGDRLPGQELRATFRHAASGIEVAWRAVLRDGANYFRQFFSLSCTNSGEQLTALELLDWAVTNTPATAGWVPGSPAVAGQTFFGGETPFASSTLSSNRVRFSLTCSLPFGADMMYDFSSVVGVYPMGQRRRGFLYYLERERARPYWQLFHFNSWYDAPFNVRESQMLQAIDVCERELRQNRGVGLDSYAMDDGWDASPQGFWEINTNKFPHRFDLLTGIVRSNGTHLGLWISPLGGYAPAHDGRVQAAIDQGLAPSGDLDLSFPSYYTWWVNRCSGFIRSNAVNYFKWDRAGDGATPHFMALARAAQEVRAVSTNLFLNVTVGTWPSPFWLNSIDSTWHGGSDFGFLGVGDTREQWITYRDAITYLNVVQSAELYPLTALMVGGIIYAGGVPALMEASPDLRHEARTYFGGGLALQELYLSVPFLASNNWNHLAEAAAVARANADVLVDSHWIGGDPSLLQIYGWASWSPGKAVLVLRNPSDQSQSIALEPGALFELPPGAAAFYELTASYPDQRVHLSALQAGQPTPITLDPFEVLVFDVYPRSAYPDQVPPAIVTQPASLACYAGGRATFFVEAAGTLPLTYHWLFNDGVIPEATNSSLALSNLTLALAGRYSVVVSNSAGWVVSEPGLLTVRTPDPYAAAVLLDNPIAYWRLDEPAGPMVLDSCGGHNGRSSGNVAFQQPGALGDANTAACFDGASGAEVDVPYAPDLNPAQFTIECWARATGGAGTWRSPLTSRDGSLNAPLSGYLFYAGANDHWQFWIGTGGSAWQILPGPSVVLGQWTFLVGTYDGTNQSFYVDGQMVGTVPVSFRPNVQRPLRMGAGATEGTSDFHFIGGLDEVVLYDHALDPARVQQHYAAGLGQPTGLSIQRVGSKLRLLWPGGELRQADDVTGPWTTVSNAVSPWPIDASATKQFYRMNTP